MENNEDNSDEIQKLANNIQLPDDINSHPEKIFTTFKHSKDVGAGGFGDVCKVIDKQTKVECAMKITGLRPSTDNNNVGHIQNSIDREKEMLDVINNENPNIVHHYASCLVKVSREKASVLHEVCKLWKENRLEVPVPSSSGNNVNLEDAPMEMDATGNEAMEITETPDLNNVIADIPDIPEKEEAKLESLPEIGTAPDDLDIVGQLRQQNEEATVQPQFVVITFIVIELCQCSLRDWLNYNMTAESRVLPDVKYWFRQIVDGVRFLHEKKIIHRDIKPENVLIDWDRNAKISDLGLARIIGANDMANNEGDTNTNTSENIEGLTTGIGTRLYMAPEMESKRPYGLKVDIYALGLIFLEMCEPMNLSDDWLRAYYEIRKGTYNRILEGRPDELAFFKWLTAKEPVDRPSALYILSSPYLSSD